MSDVRDVQVPDIGDFKDVPVIEVLVKPGDLVAKDAPLLVLESDKATMEVPSPMAGVVQELRVQVGDRVSQGSPVLRLLPADDAPAAAKPAGEGAPVLPFTPPGATPPATATPPAGATPGGPPSGAVPPSGPSSANGSSPSGATSDSPLLTIVPPDARPGDARPSPEQHAADARAGDGRDAPSEPAPVRASPSLRKLARELGVDLARVAASGPGGRLRREDIDSFVRQQLSRPAVAAPGTVPGLLPWPDVDFAKFGPVERQPLGRVKRIAGQNLARNWALIPHVTNFDEADITDLEAFRATVNAEQIPSGVKLTMLTFLIKASVAALQRAPDFNSSLAGDELVYKRYFHIGFAVDTPNGLVVPVLRDADKKGLVQIARETAELGALARAGKLKPTDMQGGCFSISSLGGIGGTGFTPIINAPEVAILGATRAQMRPVWDGAQFRPRLMLPLMLSWDHRVVDGAAAARFLVHLAALLGDFRRALL